MEVDGIEFEEIAGSPTESIGEDGKPTVKRVLKCAWQDRLQLAFLLRGQPYGPMLRMYPKQVDLQPFSSLIRSELDGANGYDDAQLTISYVQREPSEPGEPQEGGDLPVVVEESVENMVESLNLPWQRVFWSADTMNPENNVPLAECEAPGTLIPLRKWKLTLYGLSSLPTGLAALSGKCNEAQISSRSLQETFAAECVMYLGSSQSRQFTGGVLNGQLQTVASSWKLDLNFVIRPSFWPFNLFWRRGYDTPQEIRKHDDTQFKPVPTTNFQTAFNFGFAL